MMTYDGYQKYGANEAATYEADRKQEPIWWQEEAFIADYFSKQRPQRILDAPVGTGRFLEHYGHAREVFGIDISEDMLKQSSGRLAKLDCSHVRLVRGDIFKLEFPDSHFDLTVCWRFAHLLPKDLLTEALCELGRVTSGEILLQCYVAPHYWLRLARSLLQLPQKCLRRIFGPNPTQLPWGHIRAYFHTHETLRTHCTRAGLVISDRQEIGHYGGSTVYAYRLRKATEE